ncbi:serine-rich adhesin for platelets isoform X2 [Eurosta solidaginis]|uniref:serine-rich adhesin for platelets isoform X2 n=1 Tax=Eurosta solidaginis TaxID=178769 RepID=UPI00353125BE
MDERATELNNLTDSLGVLNLDGLNVFGDNTNTSTISSKSVNERLNERLRALETLEKANKSIKSDVNKIIQQNFIKKDYLKVPETAILTNTSNLNRTEYVPYHRPNSINISELITDESINLNYKSTCSTNSNTKVSFDPSEITGRSTHCTERKSQQMAAKNNCRLSVGDILATSFAPKARNLSGALGERASVASSTLGSLNNSNILLRTADMSLSNSDTTFGKAVMGKFSSFTSTNCTGVNSDEFEPAENMQSKLLMDEIAWAQEFATIPTAAQIKNVKENDFDVQSNPNSSVFARDPNFSMGRFFNQRSENLQNIVRSLSPERLRKPIALVDDTQSSIGVSTPKGNKKISELTSDDDVTPHIDNRTYSKAPNILQHIVVAYQGQNGDKHESKDSGNGTKEEDDSYLLSLSQIKKAFIQNIDKNISSVDLIDLLKKSKKNKSPQNRKQSDAVQNQSLSPKNMPMTAKELATNASMRHSVEQYTNSLTTLEELLSENKENWDPQKIRGRESQAETMSFTDSLLNSSDLKELQHSIAQPRSPLSPLNIPNLRLTRNEIENEIEYQTNSPNRNSSSTKLYMQNESRKSSNRSETKTVNKISSNNGSPTSLSPSLDLQRPLSSTRFDDQKSECDLAVISQNVSKSATPSKNNTAERTLLANGSPYGNLSAGLQSPPASPTASNPEDNDNNTRRLCENCSPQMRVKTQTTTTNAILQRMPSSPSASEASSAKSGLPKRTLSGFSLKSSNSNTGNPGGVIRSASRCSSSSEFSNRDGNLIPLKVTALELSWGSTRLRNSAHKSMQVKNTANKKLTLRIDVHGPGYQLVNMQGNNSLTLQSMECRTICVSFCPTVIGAAVGKLSFYAPCVAHNSASTSSMSSFLDIPLYGYGGHCSIVAQEVHIPPVGIAFLQMGYLHELSQPIQRTIRIYNKGPLLGFALASIDSVGLCLPRLSNAFEIQPAAMLIPPGTSATLRVVFRPQREDVRKITRQTKSVLTLGNLRLISGDEANRQRMRHLVARMSPEERSNVTSSKSLEALWEELPGEKVIEDLQLFKESPTITFDLLTHMRIHEVALTINDDYLDETIKSTSSFYFPDEDETVLFRTVCSPSPSNVDGLAQVLDRVDELTEEEIEQTHSSDNSSSRGEACCWSVIPNSLTFYLNGERRKLCSSLFICNSFKSRQYFEVSSNRRNVLRLTPSEGYVEPDGGHLEVEVNLLSDKLTWGNGQEPLQVTVSMENERITVPVKLFENNLPELILK